MLYYLWRNSRYILDVIGNKALLVTTEVLFSFTITKIEVICNQIIAIEKLQKNVKINSHMMSLFVGKTARNSKKVTVRFL